MAKKSPSLSGHQLRLHDILDYHETTLMSLWAWYETILKGNFLPAKFSQLTGSQLIEDRDKNLQELNQSVSLTLLAAIEASFRIDYHQRISKRKPKHGLTTAFKQLASTKDWVSLEEDILELWKQHYPLYAQIISEFNGALKYRHWLAHGRYWVPKLGRKYDYYSLSLLAQRIYVNLPLVS
ncbi:MAG: hypothetical protein BWK78_09190 [Thiotrichaceae bacterium IS1]|nr:MAG: hypothetical protein BWK78_09190 [Thiotrichaceae bacterium IS1]